MARIDRLRQVIERVLPWYDERAAEIRTDDARRVRERSVRARLDAEAIAARYERGDLALRRRP